MIVAAVSGGLDSVGMLWRLLHGDEPVHVHYVAMKVQTERGNAEGAAMRKIIPWMREHVGDFEYTESTYTRGRDQGGYDVVIVSRHIGKMCKARGLVPTAYCRGGALHDESTPGIKNRRKAALNEWQKWWPKGQVPMVRYPLRKMGRAEIWNMLPEELRMMTTSCRKPKIKDGIWTACGKCRPCREMVADSVPLEREIAA